MGKQFTKKDEKESQTDNRIAWFSLDEGDNDPARFLSYFIAALNWAEGQEAVFGKGALSMLQSPQFPPVEAILTSLINDFAEVTESLLQNPNCLVCLEVA